MRQALARLWLAAMLSCAGCVTSAPPEVVSIAPPPDVARIPPVMPGQVNEKNGHQMAQSLEDEMNREQQQNMLNVETR